VWDFNVLCSISIDNDIAGEASPTFDLNITQPRQAEEDIILPNSRLIDFAVQGDAILLTDSKRGVVWRME